MADKHDWNAIRQTYPLIDAVRSRVPGKIASSGGEFQCLCPFHAEKTPSFQIYPCGRGYQRFHCKGCGIDGDVIDFVARYDGLQPGEAIAAITGNAPPPEGRRPMPTVADTVDRYEGYTFLVPPDDVEEFVLGERTPMILNVKRGKKLQYRPSMLFPYRRKSGGLIGYVMRLEFTDGKPIVMGVWWMRRPDATEGWTVAPMRDPRPLYGLERIASRPNDPVLVTEGEKCADAGARLMPKAASVSWNGGCKAYEKTDWRSIANRQVMLWSDNDQEGEDAMLGRWSRSEWKRGIAEILLDGGNVLHYVGLDDKRPKGWDIADAEADGWSVANVKAHLKKRASPLTMVEIEERKRRLAPAEATEDQAPPPPREIFQPTVEARPVDQVKPKPAPIDDEMPPEPERPVVGNVVSLHGAPIPYEIDDSNWMNELQYTGEGKLKAGSVLNAQLMITFYERYENLFAWDEFAQRVVITREPPWRRTRREPTPRACSDDDVISLRGDLERRGLNTKKQDVGAATLVAGRYRRFNPMRDYLDGLVWDGEPRLFGGMSSGGDQIPCWLAQYAGAKDAPINAAFGGRWMIAAVARIYRPGCKVDTMLILEGKQGKRKSSLLETLATIGGVKYHTDSITDTNSKDAVQQMQGKWLVEFAELDAMNKAETNAFKGFMTRRIDNIRVPYASAPDDFPRSCIFAGTVNPDGTGYLKDATGGRRFWPVRTSEIDIEGIAADRDQLWAEATHRLREGEQWWLTDEEEEIAKVAQKARYQADPWGFMIDQHIENNPHMPIAIPALLREAIGMPGHMQNPTVEKRVAAHLVSKGYVRRLEAVELGKSAYVWVMPKEEDDAN